MMRAILLVLYTQPFSVVAVSFNKKGILLNGYPVNPTTPIDPACVGDFGTKVPDHCCTNAPYGANPWRASPGRTCGSYVFFPNDLPNVSFGVYLGCDRGVPVWGENCYPTWIMDNSKDNIYSNNYDPMSESPSTCLEGCADTLRGEGCWINRFPKQIGDMLLSTYPNRQLTSDYGNVLANFTVKFYMTLPACPPCCSMRTKTTMSASCGAVKSAYQEAQCCNNNLAMIANFTVDPSTPDDDCDDTC